MGVDLRFWVDDFGDMRSLNTEFVLIRIPVCPRRLMLTLSGRARKCQCYSSLFDGLGSVLSRSAAP